MSFKSGFQGGPYYELLSTQGRDFMNSWKESSSGIKKIYEKDVKGFVLTLEGSPATTKLVSPKDQKQSLSLVQRFLVLQLYLPKGVDFSLELGVTDLGNNKRRILLSTAQKETQVTPLHAKFPLTIIRRAVWLNLVIDMVSFIGETWTNQTFRCIDQISVSANCKLRRVFTMKSQPPDTTDDDGNHRQAVEKTMHNCVANVTARSEYRQAERAVTCPDSWKLLPLAELKYFYVGVEELFGCSNSNSGELDSIPKQCQMTAGVAHLTQVFTVTKVKCAERMRSAKVPALSEQFKSGSMPDLDLSASGRRATASDGKIAFGSKAPRAPESGRKTSRQIGLTNRSIRSQTSQNENNSSNVGASLSDNTSVLEEVQTGAGQFEAARVPPSASAGAWSNGHDGLSVDSFYTRQQSEPVTQEDYNYITNGLKEKLLAFQQPHPPREPSSDRVRRRPRIKSLGQNGILGKGDSNFISPPTSATIGQQGTRGGSAPASTLSPGAASMGLGSGDARTRAGKKRDSGVGPDVPEIQSPRKGENGSSGEHSVYSGYDSVADIISLLSRTGPKSADAHYQRSPISRPGNNGIPCISGREATVQDLLMNDRLVPELKEKTDNKEYDDEDSNLSTSASESSHPGEYEESDDETSGEKNKLHYFASPPKSAGIRRNVSPGSAEAELKQFRKSSQKSSRSNVKRTESSSNRGARLEDDFVSHSSSGDDPAVADELLHPQLRMQRSGPGSAGSQRFVGHSGHLNQNNSHSSGYHSSNYVSSLTSSPKSRGHSATKSRYVNIAPQISSSPDQRPEFDPRLYSDNENLSRASEVSPLSRMSKKSLREINNPFTEADVMKSSSSDKPYDHTRYQPAEVTDSFEAGMLATIAQEAEDELEDVPPAPQPLPLLQTLNPSEMTVTHLYSESPATTSDDDTSFSTWKAPALNQIAHNYQDEMKSRRSSDTLTSSNPRDWSGVISPPIRPSLSGPQNLEGTMEGISDELSDDAATLGQRTKGHKNSEEEEKLDLLFDPKLNCYYDPKTKKWYELVS